MEERKTILWIEGMRFIAILMIAIPHFIAMFCPQYFSLWDQYPLLLKGISGKNGVAIFMVIAGYFASKKTDKNFATYVTQRYLQFAINIALVLYVYCIACYITRPQELVYSLFEATKDAILFRDTICPTFWCIRPIFWSSILCYILGNLCMYNNDKWRLIFAILLCLLLFKMNEVWIAIGVLGYVYRIVEERFIDLESKYQWTSIVLCSVLIPLLYRHNESYLTFYMQGVSCCLAMWVISQVRFLQNIFGNKVILYLGSLSFYIFLSHTLVYQLLRNSLPENTSIAVTALLSLILLLLIAPPSNRSISISYKK